MVFHKNFGHFWDPQNVHVSSIQEENPPNFLSGNNYIVKHPFFLIFHYMESISMRKTIRNEFSMYLFEYKWKAA